MVRFDTPERRAIQLAADCLAIGLYDEDTLSGAALAVDMASRGALKRLKISGDVPVRADIMKAMEGHIIGKAAYTGRFHR